LLQTGDLGQRNVLGHVGLARRLALAVDDLAPEEMNEGDATLDGNCAKVENAF
jgi:hypothetical protein